MMGRVKRVRPVFLVLSAAVLGAVKTTGDLGCVRDG
jgi:hypothetical protein